MKMKTWIWLGGMLLCTSTIASADVLNLDQGVRIQQQQMIPLKDGVHLAARIWAPLDQKKSLPVVLVLTPYVTTGLQDEAIKTVQSGYVFAVVDVRGRGDSEGVFRPARDAGPDGAQAVEWLAKQPWCDGRVAMVGGSYVGMVQWEVLAQHPKHLAAIIPTASVYPGYDFPNWKGIPPSYVAQWLSFTSGRSANFELFTDSDYWETQFARMYKAGAPFASLAPLADSNRKVFEEWLHHQGDDDDWKAYNPDPTAYKGTDIPVLASTGYFDEDQPGEMRYYREFISNVSEAERGKLYFLTGPWDHNGTHHPKKKWGGLTFPDNSVLDIDRLRLSWLDWVLKGGKRPEMLSDQVNYYVMGDGAGEWKHTASLQDLSDHMQRYYLSSMDGPANDVFHSGVLTTNTPGNQDPDLLTSDPKDQDGLTTDDGSEYLINQSAAFHKHVLIYQSAPLTTPLTVAGFMRLTTNLSLDTPDADINAEVDEVLANGSIIQLGTDYIRARFRHGMDKEALVKPGEIEPYVFDGFYLMSRRLQAGSRLRVILSPVDTPDLERNDNTGGPLGMSSMEGGRVATFSVYLDPTHPSYIELPIEKE